MRRTVSIELMGVIVLPLISIAVAFQIAQPTRAALVACVAALTALALAATPPAYFLGLSAVVFGTYQLSDQHPLAIGGVTVYSTDLFLGLLLLRAVLPKERRPARAAFQNADFVVLAAFGAAVSLAAVRGHMAGTSPDTLVRLSIPLFYFPGYYWGFSRLIRERSASTRRIVPVLASVGVAFILEMAVARATGHRFEEVNHLGKVVTSTGATLHRDYGLSSAFIVYPILALASAAYILFERRHGSAPSWILALGLVSTALTLIRGELWGLLCASVVLVAMTKRSGVGRIRLVATIAFVGTVSTSVLLVANPALGRGIIERSIPGVHESARAASTAEYRVQALDAGLRTVREHPFGLGFVDAPAVQARGIDPNYIVHSTPAWLLIYGGWFAAVAGLASICAVVWRTWYGEAAVAWLRPATIAVWILLAIYSLSAYGLVGQPWVMGFAALLLALRFQLIRVEDE